MEPDKTAPQGKIPAPTFFICLLLVAVTLAVFWRALGCSFVDFDDPDYFSSNPHVWTGLNLSNVMWAFTTSHDANWHPVTWLSLMLDAQLFGKTSFGPHLTNLLFHAANTVLLFLLLRRLTAATWRSAFAAALFALHPLHVESVVWVAERKDVLSAFFGLLSLWAYVRFIEKFKVQSSKFKVYFAFSLLFFALGLMSKPMLVTLPFVMLLLDWWPLGRVTGDQPSPGFGTAGKWRMTRFRIPVPQPSILNHLLFEKWPFIVLSAASCVVTFVVQQRGGSVATLTKYSLPDRLENVFVSYARYLGKTLWPVGLANPYPHPGYWPVGLVLFAVALFIGLCATALWLGRRFPFVPVGWFWFSGRWFPSSAWFKLGSIHG